MRKGLREIKEKKMKCRCRNQWVKVKGKGTKGALMEYEKGKKGKS